MPLCLLRKKRQFRQEKKSNANDDSFIKSVRGKGAAYRLRLLNLPKRVQDTSESVVGYFSGNFLSGENDDNR
ncbi:hypothetical protein BI375_14515 [Vibrio rotiferianus]|uniref:Uncharacterized protein n=1 Tax=Vibrio rotiferianus TaxID=190895 RepID=A0ABX3DB21_9VIBR|nr:hypothetical protein BI375_14515 [Vibrio rotiferianus]